MRIISREVEKQIAQASWIRRMFEMGTELKNKFGSENVYDFSLGNPDVPPPGQARQELHRIADTLDRPLSLGYTPNAGRPALRKRLAEVLSDEQKVSCGSADLIVTCGAAGGLCAFFKSVLEPGDEVICPSPYFVEYGFYAGHFGGNLCPVPMNPDKEFALNARKIAAAITPRTRVVLINSPNNPTGTIYSGSALLDLAKVLEETNRGRERPVFLVADEPYRSLVYDDAPVPPVLPLSPFAVVIGSFSKSLSLAGERIGYLCIHPEMPEKELLMSALAMTNRTLGYVNAPVLGQRLVENLLGSRIDMAVYRKRRSSMASVLDAAGLEYGLPRGGFYFFPRVPGGDDALFVKRLLQQRILAVPGRGFGAPGFFRLSFAVDEPVINAAGEGFIRAVDSMRSGA